MYGESSSTNFVFSQTKSRERKKRKVEFIFLREPSDLLLNLLFRGSYPNTTESDNLHINKCHRSTHKYLKIIFLSSN